MVKLTNISPSIVENHQSKMWILQEHKLVWLNFSYLATVIAQNTRGLTTTFASIQMILSATSHKMVFVNSLLASKVTCSCRFRSNDYQTDHNDPRVLCVSYTGFQISTPVRPGPTRKIYSITILPHSRWYTIYQNYSDVIMSAMAFHITGVSVVFSTVCSGADQRTHRSSASLAFVREIHQWPGDFPHKKPVTRQMYPFDDVIMKSVNIYNEIISVGWDSKVNSMHE